MALQKTYSAKAGDIQHDWVVVDAAGQTLGRLATHIAQILRGKHKPTFTPSMDTGDYVVVINAEKLTVTGNKLLEKYYYHFSGFHGGLKSISLRDQLAQHPDRVITEAVKGMLPHNRLGRAIIKKLKVYAGPEHPHQAQMAKPSAK
jgi:large subunit ribosomal protein L13